MAIEIDKKIVGYDVLDEEKQAQEQEITKEVSAETNESDSETAEIIHMHEKLERPEMLLGSTYKVKTPQSEHALYITINDVVLNQGTRHEMRRPYEIFINSKNMDHFQWIVALTRIISAVFRKGGDVTFLVDELRSVFDPRGGYFKKGGKYKPSLVAEIGDAIIEQNVENGKGFYHRAMELQPDNQDILSHIGYAYAERSMQQEAVEIFEKLQRQTKSETRIPQVFILKLFLNRRSC